MMILVKLYHAIKLILKYGSFAFKLIELYHIIEKDYSNFHRNNNGLVQSIKRHAWNTRLKRIFDLYYESSIDDNRVIEMREDTWNATNSKKRTEYDFNVTITDWRNLQ